MGNRLLVERALGAEEAAAGTGGAPHGPRRSKSRRLKTFPARSLTINLAESPLGWLMAHGHVTARQFEAGEKLRFDWERAQLPPSVTMRWDAAPPSRTARGAPSGLDPTESQLAARRRFEVAVATVGAGLSDILWRIVCAGEGMREAERALAWPARSGKLVLGLALDRLADFYRLG